MESEDKNLCETPPHFLRAWRKHRDMTLEQVAAEIGVSHPNLSKIERGKHKFDQELLEKLSHLYRTDIVSLLVINPKQTEPIWHYWRQATQDEKRKIVEMAKIIISDHHLVAAE